MWCNNAHYVISPHIIKWWDEKVRGFQLPVLLLVLISILVNYNTASLDDQAQHWGPIISGMLFGAAWWFWADAVTMTDRSVPFDHWLPGIIATLAVMMINIVRKEELTQVDQFDDAQFCR